MDLSLNRGRPLAERWLSVDPLMVAGGEVIIGAALARDHPLCTKNTSQIRRGHIKPRSSRARRQILETKFGQKFNEEIAAFP